MSAANRLQDEWLLSYAAGNLTHGRSLMVASHLAYHEDMKEIVSNAESIGGVLLDSIDTAAVSEALDQPAARQLDSRVDEFQELPSRRPWAAWSAGGYCPSRSGRR